MALETLNKEGLALTLVNNNFKGYFTKHGRRYIYLVTNNSKVGVYLSEEAIKTIKKRIKKVHVLSATKHEIDKALCGTVTCEGPVSTITDDFLN